VKDLAHMLGTVRYVLTYGEIPFKDRYKCEDTKADLLYMDQNSYINISTKSLRSYSYQDQCIFEFMQSGIFDAMVEKFGNKSGLVSSNKAFELKARFKVIFRGMPVRSFFNIEFRNETIISESGVSRSFFQSDKIERQTIVFDKNKIIYF
jgi:hypothetical protein